MSFDVRRAFTGRGLLVTLVAAGVVAGGGATAVAAASDGGPRDGRDPAGAVAASPSGASVTAVQAAGAALKAVPGTAEEVGLDDGVWEVDVLAENGGWREVTVDARDGKVRTNRPDDGDDDDRNEAGALRKAGITASEAAEAALRTAPGTVTSVEFDGDDGASAWEVEVAGRDGSERELTVDAATGKVAVGDDDRDDDGDDRDDRDDD